ncbi:type 1 fimbrial protein [Providencia alcalifaciens]|uniref:Fimbrial protein n=2 Tax=Providencia alcalifaciens TaxID=126385 RepID=B6XH47_9GAMM|nr:MULTISPECIES: fimbrial protein [Providencia]ATG15403.1 type 1 fimbrial protein [Providencia alcalifaciens]EEB45240.1 fimbrial protein [Providencia alcalifaciens DSM 30120]MBF0692227.1 type 1 fimbrial protein [Providencia alcalifaciens]MTB32013.1 type 1 fimbrial protein [Providencia alcalifaciens]MTC26726.1 type 1 fimbrial protein [Providencia alcalifaciens]
MMNSLQKLLIGSAYVVCHYAYSANNIALYFNGSIKASPCQIEQTDYIIDLKTINIANIRDNLRSPWVNFNVSLKNCPTSSRQSIMTLTGTPDPTNPTYFINRGTATHVALDLTTGNSHTQVKNGTQITTPINQQTHSVQIPFSARVAGLNNGMTAGTFRSHVEFTFTYN